MDAAAELLAPRPLTVREVAHRVGYRQPAQFAKAFRRHHGRVAVDVPQPPPHGRRAAGRRFAPPPESSANTAVGRDVTFVARQDIGCAPTWSEAETLRCGRAVIARGRPRRDRVVIGIVLGLAINWFPPQGSTQADKIDTFWDVLIIVSVPIFVLVATVVSLGASSSGCARARRTSTARRSTATRASRSSGPRCPPRS